MTIKTLSDGKVKKISKLYDGDYVIPGTLREIFILLGTIPGTIKCHDVKVEGNNAHITMNAYKPLKVKDIKDPDFFMERLMRYTLYLHDRGIIWCDVKDGNILINDDQIPILIDFDLSHLKEIPFNADYITNGYFPPTDDRMTTYSDSWSLGLIFLMIKTKNRDILSTIDDHIKKINDPIINALMIQRLPLSKCYGLMVQRCLKMYPWYNSKVTSYEEKDLRVNEMSIFKKLIQQIDDMNHISTIYQIVKALFSEDRVIITNKELLNKLIHDKVNIFQ